MTNDEITGLVSECLAGKKESYEPIARYFQGKIYRICYQILGTPQDAEDAAMDVFIKAYRSLTGYNSQYTFSSWISRIAVNHSISVFRRRKLENDYFTQQVSNQVLSTDNQCPEKVFISDCRESDLSDALETLSVKFRTALMLKYQENLSYDQIGKILDIPVNTVGSLILRGKKDLRKKLSNTQTLNKGA